MKKRFWPVLAAAAAVFLLILSCGGGFGADSDNASDVGPGIFITDSTRR